MKESIARAFAQPTSAFTVGLMLRLAVVAVLFANGYYDDPEMWENGLIADHMWNGRGFSAEWGRGVGPTSFQAPGYPYFLVFSWHLFGRGPAACLFVGAVQSLALSSMVFPIHRLTRRWFGEVPAILAVWVCVVAPLYLWFPVRIHHTALAMSVHPWLLLGWLLLSDDGLSTSTPRRRAGLALGVGGLTGLAGLTQPVLLSVYGILSAILVARASFERRFKQASMLLLAGMVTLLALTPWTIRNYRVHHRLLLVKNSFGKEFWMGNNPNATGTSFAEGGETEITMQYPPRALALRGKVSEMEVMDEFSAEAWEYVRSDKAGFVGRTVKKIVWFWTIPPLGVSRNYGRANSMFYGTLIGYWGIFLTLTGLAFVADRPPREYLLVLGLFAVLYSISYGLIHVGQPRYRGEIECVFLPAVGAGAAWLVSRMAPETYAALLRSAKFG